MKLLTRGIVLYIIRLTNTVGYIICVPDDLFIEDRFAFLLEKCLYYIYDNIKGK